MWEATDPEGYAKFRTQQDIEDSKKKAEEIQKQKDKQKQIEYENFIALPESCRYVESSEVRIYETGPQCLNELKNRITEWCNMKNRSSSCTNDLLVEIANSCYNVPIISDEVCEMRDTKDLYVRASKELWNNLHE